MALSRWDCSVLAQGYGLGTPQVSADARLVSGWSGPLDDLLADLRVRHSWSAAAAYRYLRSVRRALLGQLPS
jgi:hypothetical protein